MLSQPAWPCGIVRRLQESLADTPVVLLNGPRQSGKTTLVRQFASEQRPYLTLDDATTCAAAREDPQGFIRRLDEAVIDEVQRVPELLLAIKLAVAGAFHTDFMAPAVPGPSLGAEATAGAAAASASVRLRAPPGRTAGSRREPRGERRAAPRRKPALAADVTTAAPAAAAAVSGQGSRSARGAALAAAAVVLKEAEGAGMAAAGDVAGKTRKKGAPPRRSLWAVASWLGVGRKRKEGAAQAATAGKASQIARFVAPAAE
jgi:hypothetical protein